MSETERIDQRIENTLFAAALVTYAYFYQAADQSIAARFDLIRSILERHTLWIDGFCGFNTADIIQVAGHYYSVKAPGTSLTGLIPWSFVTWFLTPLAGRNESLFWALATYLTIVLSVSLLVAAFVLLAAIAYAGWRLVAIEPPKVTRAEARREAKRAQRR